ncbi:MAG TPA: protein kinase [Actinomycetota bacterium]
MAMVAAGQRLAGRYVLEEHVATGGMATVWRARDQVLARTVAVKILRDDLANDPEFRERFRREAIAAARLNHPSIINVFDTGTDEDVVFIVMEFFAGRTLAEVLTGAGALDPERVVDLVSPVLEALGYAHSQGVIHRDVKPANILVSDDGRVKVTDFGIAKAVVEAGADLTTTGSMLGTVQYLSPEQVEGSPVDPRSDLYSTGAVTYELLAGRPPFRAETPVATAMMRLTTNPKPLRDIRPGLPRELEATVSRAMSVRPDDRFPSADAMRTALQRWDAAAVTLPRGIPPVPKPLRRRTPPAPRAPRPSSVFRSWMLVPLVVVLLAVAAIAVGLIVGRLQLGGPLGVRAAAGSSKPAGGGGTPVRLVQAKDDDPYGDGSEDPQDAALAIDGNQGTSWFTDHYSSAKFGNLKPGLGLWVGLGRTVEVTQVTVTSPIPGWAFELLPGAAPNDNARPLASTDGRVTFTVGRDGRATVDLPHSRTSGLMIWIVRLAPDQGRFRAAVSEIEVRAAT